MKGVELERSAMPEAEFNPSPAALLASFLSDTDKQTQLIILTGPSGSGKTAYCQALFSAAQGESLQSRGLISPPVFINGQKIGIDVIDLLSGNRRRLAAFRSQPEPGSFIRDWRFDWEALAWGENCLQEISYADLLIVDELGPLEFYEGRGWISGLRLLDARSYRLGCVVIRPDLLETALLRWPWARVIRIPEARPA
jgi:nucleoside-triphosphatase